MRLSLLAVMSALAIVASACGGDSDEGTSGGSPDDTGDAAGESGSPVYGGNVVYGLEAENSGGWCLPEGQLAISGIQVARAIYDTLTAPNEDGDYVPFLAESVEPNEDFTEWTVTLQDGVTFHDGTALTAEVVKNNLDAYRGEYAARQPLLLRFIFEPVAAVDVVDDTTLTIRTSIPWPALPAALYSNGRAGIVAQAQLDDAETCDTNLIGTGPFVLDEWVVNDHLSASRNPDYWGTDSEGNQLPYLDSIEFRPVGDPVTKANAVLSGDLDMAHGSGGATTSI
ncbi:MAG: ABC transporter substrate-binding protein, partial [Microthrixaceae bacterium]